MEQVFDFREFLVGLWKKGKVVLLFAVIFAVLGAGFGFYRFPKEDKMMSSSTATVGLVDKLQDATALSSAMTMINAYITSDTFYLELMNEIGQRMEKGKVEKLFNGDLTPKLDDIKEIIKIQTKGNIIIAEITATSKDIPQETSELCIKYIIDNVTKYNENAIASKLGNEVVNVTLQNNDTLGKEIGLFAILGMAGGIVVSILFIFFIDILTVKVKRADDLKQFNLPVMNENADRTTAVILSGMEAGENPVIALTSTSDADIMHEATELKQALLRTGSDYAIIDQRGKSVKNLFEIQAIYKEKLQPILVCCDNINNSTDSMYCISAAGYVLFCEQIKLSHTDNIENGIGQIKNLKTKLLGIILR